MSSEKILTYLTGVDLEESRLLSPGHGRKIMARRCQAITKKGTQCTWTGRYLVTSSGRHVCSTHLHWFDD